MKYQIKGFVPTIYGSREVSACKQISACIQIVHEIEINANDKKMCNVQFANSQ